MKKKKNVHYTLNVYLAIEISVFKVVDILINIGHLVQAGPQYNETEDCGSAE